MQNLHSDKILILDFGSQYTQLIARRVREIGVYCEIWARDHAPDEIAKFAPKGIILSGSPESAIAPGAPRIAQQVLHLGVPRIGLCYRVHPTAPQLCGKA